MRASSSGETRFDCWGESAADLSQKGSQRNPSAAKNQNTASQPSSFRIKDASGIPRMGPAYPPLQQNPAAREYSWRGNQRARMPLMDGKVPLSPTPSTTRSA